MKKLITSFALLACLVSGAAENRCYDLIAVPAICVSNGLAAWGAGATNFSSVGIYTNLQGTIFTNRSGALEVVAASESSTINLLNTVPMPLVTDGLRFTNSLDNVVIGSVFCRLYGGSGANAAVTVVLRPVYSDSPIGVESTAATEQVVVAFTATGATVLADAMPVVAPFTWRGAKWLRCHSIVNADADATSQVWITDLSFNGEY